MEMSGFIGVYNLLKKQGHEFVVITARGGFVKKMNILKKLITGETFIGI